MTAPREWDVVDEASRESFPASDPPGYYSSHASTTARTSPDPETIAFEFVQAWNRRDPDAIAALFDEDAEFVNVTGLWWHDREAIRRAHAYGLTRIFADSTLELVDTRTKWLAPAIAVVHAKLRLTGQTPVAGVAQPGARTTIFSFVVHQTEDGWRCASAHNTDVVPNQETNIVDEQGRFAAVNYRDAEPH